ncbi:hypothetical protein PHLCEN_2v4368 [Hermanssonia centrifuga]|uniref:NAD(P)-binding protein n=1 Tax=Hermanssonia centrifuga TaxID=98765 RepID=A0A2R6PVF4_9APHY|nr:hypothetical protein PHLCEN_2v4368 [Hermanssonia centrifuga]
MGLLILSASDVDQATSKFTPDELVDLMAKVFTNLSRNTQEAKEGAEGVCIPHRGTILSSNHRVLFMPSRLSAIGTAIKIVSVPTPSAPADARERGLPASTMVIDDRTGEVTAVINARKLTALRNAASSLLASQLFVPPLCPSGSSPRVLVAVGAGAQIAAHLSLFLSSYPSITVCKIYNRSANARLHSLVESLKAMHPSVQSTGVALPNDTDGENLVEKQQFSDAIRSADIIVTATSSTVPLFPSSYVSPGTLLCLIGSYTPVMHEIDTDLVKRGGTIVVDYKAGALAEAGELIKADVGPSDVLELGELIQTSNPALSRWAPRIDMIERVRASGDVTIFKSVGVGIQDVAIAHAVVESARKHCLGTVVDDYDSV